MPIGQETKSVHSRREKVEFAMNQQKLEERVASLERQMAKLQSTASKDWRSTVGMFGNDEVMKRIFDYALQFRERDREKARQTVRRPDRKR